MTERYQGWGRESVKCSEPTRDIGELNAIRRSEEALQPVIPSGFTAVNRQDQQGSAASRINNVGQTGPAMADDSHTVNKDPIVARYLGRGEEHGDYSHLEQLASTASGKRRSDESSVRSVTAHKQPKKRSSSAPQKPAKRAKTASKTSIADGMHVTKFAVNDSKLDAQKSSGTYQTTEQRVAQRSQEALEDAHVISRATAQRLDAWKYQASHSSSSSKSTPFSATNPQHGRVSILSPVTSIDVVRSSQGYGCTIYQGSSISASQQFSPGTRVTLQSTTAQLRTPPSTGQALESIAEEDSSASQDAISYVNILPVSQPSNTSRHGPNITEDLEVGDKQLDDDDFDGLGGLDDEDLLCLDFSSDPIHKSTAPIEHSRQVSFLQDNSLPTPHPSDPVTSSPLSRADVCLITAQDDADEVELIGLTVNTQAITTTSQRPRPTLETPRVTTDNGQYSSSPIQLPSAPQALLSSSPPPDSYTHNLLHPPIVRSPFPKPIRYGSLLVGISASTVLRTCFRIGEALNVGCTAARSSQSQTSDNMLIELYAKVLSSHREGVTQFFTFADLFHEARPPFLKGTCECWKGSELWEYDSGKFLGCEGNPGEKKLCRAMGKMKRDGKGWKFVV